MKRIIAIVMLLLVVVAWCVTRTVLQPTEITAPTLESFREQLGEITPLLYEVTDADGDRIWLFGSIHVGFEDMYPLPDYVTDAFREADSLAVEVNVNNEDPQAAIQTLSMLSYDDGTTIRDHIDETLYDRAASILEDNLYTPEALLGFKPYMWSSCLDNIMLEQSFFDTEYGIDRHLLDLAEQQNKTIVEVESAEFQYAMLGGFSDDLQELLLESNVELYESGMASTPIRMMMAIWAKGDENLFSAYLGMEGSALDEDEEALYSEYDTAMIIERNLSMTAFAEQALEDGGDMFICVGAAHVVGEGAMADLLEERGYTVELVR